MKKIGTRSRGERGEAKIPFAARRGNFLRAFARGYSRDKPGSDLLRAFRLHASRFAGHAALVRRSLCVGGCATLLSGCSTTGSPAVPQCIPLTSWTSAQQDEMRKEYDALPKDAILRAVFMDWVGLRDADRACMSAGEK